MKIFKTLFEDLKKIGISILRVGNTMLSILASKKILTFYLLKKNINIVMFINQLKKSYKLM